LDTTTLGAVRAHRGGPVNHSDADWADPVPAPSGLHFPETNARRLARILETTNETPEHEYRWTPIL
jgi:hypothetical protein